MNIDEWHALPDKIDMITNEETASIARDRYMSIEAMRQRGMNDTSDQQRYLRNFVDFVLTKNSTDKEQTNEN